MAPEVLIVGDVARRSELLERIRELGYEAAICSGPALEERVARGSVPSAVVVCTDDAEPRALMAELRRTRRGSGIPVTLYGPLGGRIGDLADVLDLGADHFLESPADDDQLEAALDELVGPGSGGLVRSPARGSAEPRSGTTRSRAGGTGATDVVLGQLHRTLDMLEARLKDQNDGDADDLDLAALGFDDLPDLGGERRPPGDAGSSLELSQPTRRPASSVSEPAPQPRSRSRRREATERLGKSSPRARTRSSVSAERTPSRPIRTTPLPVDERGSLERMEVPRLLWTLHEAGYDGELVLMNGRAEKRLWWHAGQIAFAEGNLSHDRLSDGLFRRGLLTREQYDRARRLTEGASHHAAEHLVDAGLLKSGEMPRVLREHLGGVIDATFGWTEGSWELDPDQPSPGHALRDVPVTQIIAEGIRHRLDESRLEVVLGGADRYPRFTGDASEVAVLAEQLRMTAAEEALMGRLDGRRSLRELSSQTDVDVPELLGLVYTLEVLGRLELDEQRRSVPADVDPVNIDVERIRDRLQLSRLGDYFAVLGVPRDASRIEVRRAHAQLRQTFSAEQLEADAREAMSDELDELFDLIEEAREVLVDESLRSAYLAHLEES